MDNKKDEHPETEQKLFLDFSMTVIQGLTQLQEGQKYIVGHLEKMNGTQADLLKRMAAAELFEKTHPLKCPIGVHAEERIDELETRVDEHITTRNAEVQTSNKWWDALKPAIMLLAGGLLVLLATHLDQWLK
jgi:hypothetical protein